MRQPESADEVLLDVALLCVNRLSDKYLHDKALFLVVASLQDVKIFQKALLGCAVDSNATQKMGEQNDPAIVVGVLIKCLKDTRCCVMHELYEELLVGIDLNEERKRITSALRSMLTKLNHQKFRLVKALMSMLNRLVISHPGEHSFGHLANSTAPALCRLVDSAYMSIRHEEDLRRIKPVVAYMIENVKDIFTCDLVPTRPTPSDQPDAGTNSPRKLSRNSNDLPNRTSSGQAISSLQNRAGPSSNGAESLNYLNLKIQTASATSSPDESSAQSRQGNIHSGTWEWAVFQSVIFSHVQDVVAGNGRKDSDSGGSQEQDRRKTKHTASEPNPNPNLKENDNTLNKQVKSSSGSNARSSDANKLPITKKVSRLQHRRHMVADCKNLKSQISNFEGDWRAKHSRAPKSSERGAMQSVYTQYKTLKLNIRDHAATDIQRVARGCLLRSAAAPKRENSRLSKLSLKMAACAQSTLDRPCSDDGEVVPMDVAPQDTPPQSAQSTGSLPPDVYCKYKDLLSQKRELKKKLKRFDNDFEKQAGHAPKKSDKEVMRPMYQRYHEVKQSLDELKVTVEAAYGPLPPELLEEVAKQPVSTRDISFNAVLAKSADDSDVLKPSLQEEKRQLHLCLKAYEKDFVSRNGRPVTRPEDIAPVAQEYQRYKDLKAAIAGVASIL